MNSEPKSKIQYYYPVFMLVGLGLVFLLVPFLAQLVLSGIMFFLGGVYFIFLNRVIKLRDQMTGSRGAGATGQGKPDTFSSDAQDIGNEPNFRNVSIRIVKGTSWFKEQKGDGNGGDGNGGDGNGGDGNGDGGSDEIR